MTEIEEMKAEVSRLDEQIKSLSFERDQLSRKLSGKMVALWREERIKNEKPPSKRIGHVQLAVLESLPDNGKWVPVPAINEKLSQFKPPSISRAISLLIKKGKVLRYPASMRKIYGDSATGSSCSIVCKVRK